MKTAGRCICIDCGMPTVCGDHWSDVSVFVAFVLEKVPGLAVIRSRPTHSQPLDVIAPPWAIAIAELADPFHGYGPAGGAPLLRATGGEVVEWLTAIWRGTSKRLALAAIEEAGARARDEDHQRRIARALGALLGDLEGAGEVEIDPAPVNWPAPPCAPQSHKASAGACTVCGELLQCRESTNGVHELGTEGRCMYCRAPMPWAFVPPPEGP